MTSMHLELLKKRYPGHLKQTNPTNLLLIMRTALNLLPKEHDAPTEK